MPRDGDYREVRFSCGIGGLQYLTDFVPHHLSLTDPSSISDIAQDAARMVFLECDNDGCAMSEAVKAGNEWHVNHGLEAGAQGGETYEKVLMIAMEGNSE